MLVVESESGKEEIPSIFEGLNVVLAKVFMEDGDYSRGWGSLLKKAV